MWKWWAWMSSLQVPLQNLRRWWVGQRFNLYSLLRHPLLAWWTKWADDNDNNCYDRWIFKNCLQFKTSIFKELERQQQLQRQRRPVHHLLLNIRVTIAVDLSTISDAGKEILMILLVDLAATNAVFRNVEFVMMAKMAQNPKIILMSTAFKFRIHQEEQPPQFLLPR